MNFKKNRLALLSVALGLWLIGMPLTFGDSSSGMIFSDILSGLLLIVFGGISLAPERMWSGWAIGGIGLWLQAAPLIFWEKSAVMYLNNTIVGALAIILAFQITQKKDWNLMPCCPEGWSFNPSGWIPRILTVFLAIICWFFSRYMAVYQLGYIHHMTDPFFTDGTLRVITSKISQDFPVADAGLGALGYTLEFLLGWQGSARRWAEMPWLVVGYGILVVPVSVASIVLIILQPVAVGAWCSWCLGVGIVMLFMILLAAPELVAVLQLLYRTYKRKDPFWRVFWKGSPEECTLTPLKARGRAPREQAWGFNLPWNLALSIALGVCLMFSPSILHSHSVLAASNYIEGPLVITFSAIALSEAFRALRFLNILLGIGLIIAPWFAPQVDTISLINNIVIGLAIIGLSFPKGPIRERYGSWEKMIR